MAKNYEKLKLSDDFMFGKVMEDGVLYLSERRNAGWHTGTVPVHNDGRAAG